MKTIKFKQSKMSLYIDMLRW